MTTVEYKRKCKQPGCNEDFVVSARSIDADRAIGFSEPEYCPKHRMLHAKSYSRIACHHFDVDYTPYGRDLVEQLELAEIENLGPGGLGLFTRDTRPFVGGSEYTPPDKFFQIAEKTEEIIEGLEKNQVMVLVGTTGSGKSTYVPWLLLNPEAAMRSQNRDFHNTEGELLRQKMWTLEQEVSLVARAKRWSRRGPIVVTQPRIQATRQVPRYIANSLNGTSLGVGAEIGFCHSNANEFDRRSRLRFVTDGKLINDIVAGRIAEYSIIMIDEAHERSVNIDLILGLLREQLFLYPHLRVIIASATIDHEAFRGYFGGSDNVPFIYSEGRAYPINKYWWGDENHDWWKSLNEGNPPDRDDIPEIIAQMVEDLCKKTHDGHILVFMPGSHEINQTVSAIDGRRIENLYAFPLYAQRPLDEQQLALDPDRVLRELDEKLASTEEESRKIIDKERTEVESICLSRRVVVSTNVAETSLTVEGVKYVIDSGYVKQSYWNSESAVSELRTVRHSRAGCRQRWGRAGRIAPGDAYMLYTKESFEDNALFREDTPPEIIRSSTEQVLLTAKAAGVNSIRDFKWMPLKDKADRQRFQKELDRALTALRDIGALDPRDDGLTAFGLELRGMPAGLDSSRVFMEADRFAMGVEAATLVPFLKLDHGLHSLFVWDRTWDSYRKYQIRCSHIALLNGCHDDLEVYLKIWMLWEALDSKERKLWAEENGINFKSFEEKIQGERRKLLGIVMDWRKIETERRSIALEKLDVLRALVAIASSSDLYVMSDAFGSSSGGELFMGLAGDVEEEFDINASSGGTRRGLSDIFVKINPKPGESPQSSTVELSPTSICAGSTEARFIVLCRRQANRFPWAAASILGLNAIKLDPSWFQKTGTDISPRWGETSVQRALFLSLLINRNENFRKELIQRLFLPIICPIGSFVDGIITDIGSDGRLTVKTTVTPRQDTLVSDEGLDPFEVEGVIHPSDLPASFQVREVSIEIYLDEIKIEKVLRVLSPHICERLRYAAGSLYWVGRMTESQLEECRLATTDQCLHKAFEDLFVLSKPFNLGDACRAVVIGYTSDGQKPMLELGAEQKTDNSFAAFKKRFKEKMIIKVEMLRILEDPLGRNPLFVVREPESGLEIPMAGEDFCGETKFQPYFGRRFKQGEQFRLQIEEIDSHSKTVRLARGQILLKEYADVLSAVKNGTITMVRTVSVDSLGAYFELPGGYIGFVRQALCPKTPSIIEGQSYKAKIRFRARNVNMIQLEEDLRLGQLPPELDLGIDLDLMTPLAYESFLNGRDEREVIGSVPRDCTVSRILQDRGQLLVDLTISGALRGRVGASELGLHDEELRLRRADEYDVGDHVHVRIVRMKPDRAEIECSIRRSGMLPNTLQAGQKTSFQVLRVEPNFRDKAKFNVYGCDSASNPIEAQCIGKELPSVGATKKLLVREVKHRLGVLLGEIVED